MDKPLNYDKTFTIELLNEFSHSVHARLLNFVLKNGIDTSDKDHRHIMLLDKLSELLDTNLFELSSEELNNRKKHWEEMNNLVKDMTRETFA